MGALDRRYALVGWVAWTLAKRRLLSGAGRDPEKTGCRRLLRWLAAVAVLAGFAALWAKRAGTEPGSRL